SSPERIFRVASAFSAGRDFAVANAAAAIFVAGRAETLADAIPIATESIDSGAAARVLERLVESGPGR
ncbi:MAG: hypothetical protein ACKOGM_08195, partial [Solirubrobacterales bacterium]